MEKILWTNELVEKNELEWLRIILNKDKEKKDLSNHLLYEVLMDKEYQKIAVEPVKDKLGNTSLRGIITMQFFLTFSEIIDEGILDRLVYNLLFLYADEKKTIPLCLTENLEREKYLSLILKKDIDLKWEYKEKMAEIVALLASSIREKDSAFDKDVDVITSFIVNDDIPIKLKEKVINEATTEVAEAVYAGVLSILKELQRLNTECFDSAKSRFLGVIMLLEGKI